MNKIILFGFLIILSGCIEIVDDAYIDKIENLQLKCDSLQELHQSVKIDNLNEIKSWKDQMHNKIRLINEPIELELARSVDRFKKLRTVLPPYDSSRIVIQKQLENEAIHLQNLRSDIENGSGNRGKYDEYIRFESSKIDNIEAAILKRDSIRSEIITIFNDLHGNLDAALNQMLTEE